MTISSFAPLLGLICLIFSSINPVELVALLTSNTNNINENDGVRSDSSEKYDVSAQNSHYRWRPNQQPRQSYQWWPYGQNDHTSSSDDNRKYLDIFSGPLSVPYQTYPRQTQQQYYYDEPRKTTTSSPQSYNSNYYSKSVDNSEDKNNLDDDDEADLLFSSAAGDDAVTAVANDPCYKEAEPLQPIWPGWEQDEPEQRRVAQRCIPNFLNVAFGDGVKASSTCGQTKPENVCFDSDEHDDHDAATGRAKCQVCDQSSWNTSHAPAFLTDLNNPNNITFWASAPLRPEFDVADGQVEYENVTLHFALGKRYEITYITLQFYANAMPESLIIYKSNDYGETWQPFQYYSSECSRMYGINPLESNQIARSFYDDTDGSEPQQAFCSNHLKQHSTDASSHNMRHSPITTKNHRIAFSTLDGRPMAHMYEDSETLQEWTMATDIKVVLQRPLITSMFSGGTENELLEDSQPTSSTEVLEDELLDESFIDSSFNPTVVVTNNNANNDNRFFRQRRRSPRSAANREAARNSDDELDEAIEEDLEKLEKEENTIHRNFEQTTDKLMKLRKALLRPTATNISAFFLQPVETSTTASLSTTTKNDEMDERIVDKDAPPEIESIPTTANFVRDVVSSSSTSTTTVPPESDNVQPTELSTAVDYEENDIDTGESSKTLVNNKPEFEVFSSKNVTTIAPTKVFPTIVFDESELENITTSVYKTSTEYSSTTTAHSTTTTTTSTTTQASTTITVPVYPVYAITDFAVGGRCHCNGHGSSCERDATTGQQRCVCRHNTEGVDCERCKKSFVDRPWRPATTKNANECVECTCNNRARRCVFNEELWKRSGGKSGGVCLGCQHNTAGRYCHECREGHYRDLSVSLQDPKACKACYCHPVGTIGKTCNMTAVHCACKPGVVGAACNRCAPGYRPTRLSVQPCVEDVERQQLRWNNNRGYGRYDQDSGNYGSNRNYNNDNKHNSYGVDNRTSNARPGGYRMQQYDAQDGMPNTNYYTPTDTYDRRRNFMHKRPPDKSGKKCGKCKLLGRKPSTKRFCKKHYAVQVLIRGRDFALDQSSSSWARFDVEVQFVWKRRLHASPALGANHIWLPARAAACGCPPLKTGQRYIVLLGPPSEQHQNYAFPNDDPSPSVVGSNTKMIIDRTSLVIPWSQKMSARFSKFQRRAMLGKCDKF